MHKVFRNTYYTGQPTSLPPLLTLPSSHVPPPPFPPSPLYLTNLICQFVFHSHHTSVHRTVGITKLLVSSRNSVSRPGTVVKDGPKATGRPEVEDRKENTEKKMADMNVQNVKIQNECCSKTLDQIF